MRDKTPATFILRFTKDFKAEVVWDPSGDSDVLKLYTDKYGEGPFVVRRVTTPDKKSGKRHVIIAVVNQQGERTTVPVHEDFLIDNIKES